jgi:hypothetical protein
MAPTFSSAALDAAKAQRGRVRSAATKHIGKADVLNTSSPKAQLQNALALLNDITSRLAEADKGVSSAINDLRTENNTVVIESLLDDDFEAADNYRDNLVGKTAILEGLLSNDNRVTGSTPRENSPDPSSVGTSSAPPVSAFKVPNFKLSKFDGSDILLFPSWYDQFQSLIGQHPHLSDVQKFGLLKESLEGNPRVLIASLLTTSENYKRALELLESSFNDPNLLLGLFVTRLNGFAACKDVRSSAYHDLVFQFEQVFVEISNLLKRFRSAESAARDSATELDRMNVASFFLTPVLLGKVPHSLQMKWLEKHSDATERYSVSGLLSFLKEDLKCRQVATLMNANNAIPVQPSSQQQSKAPTSAPLRASPRSRPHAATANMTAIAHSASQPARPFLPDDPGTFPRHHAASAYTAHSAPLRNDRSQRPGPRPCPVCTASGHFTQLCPAFLGAPPHERTQIAASKQLCVNCLDPRHHVETCQSPYSCRHCGQRHHSLLCTRSREPAGLKAATPPFVSAQTQPSVNAHASVNDSVALTANCHSQALLQTVTATVTNPVTHQSLTATALLDSGSSHSWINQAFAEKLDLPAVGQCGMRVSAFGGTTVLKSSKQMLCRLSGEFTSSTGVEFRPWSSAILVSPVAQGLPEAATKSLAALGRFDLYDGQTRDIDLVIGADYYQEFTTSDRVRGHPTAIRSIFGWTLHGSAQARYAPPTQSFALSVFEVPTDAASLGALEAIGITDQPDALVDPFDTVVMVNGRPEVRLPFRSDQRPISNQRRAEARLRGTVRKLSPVKKEEYDAGIKRLVDNGYVELSPAPPQPGGFFLPHRGIHQKGKLRIVFDGSAEGPGGTSLNDCLDTGPDLLQPDDWGDPVPTSALVPPEEVQVTAMAAALTQPLDFLDLDGVSSLSKAVVRLAWAKRFLWNARVQRSHGIRHSGPLTPEETADALNVLIRTEQERWYSAERLALSSHGTIDAQSSLLRLRPRLCTDRNLLVTSPRFGGPGQALVPARSRLAHLLILDAHPNASENTH